MSEAPETKRPDPDALLAQLQAAEKGARRGKFHVFLGMCAGVGKTYAMLRAGRRLMATGVEVAVAVVETHGRAETEELLAGLPVIPSREVGYRGVTLREMDIDEVLRRRPRVVLIDELAHTNAPGSRHPKRYQDALEILDAGIDVLTTLNVQHIESRVDVVRQIAGVTVRETVPDSVIDAADEIQLIDLTPEQLRERLAEGKVYFGERAATAADRFFKEENLAALREMALRVMAERAGQDLRVVMSAKRIEGPWKSGERLMVGVGPSPFSERLIRQTRRMAAALDAPWMAVYVESGPPLTDEAKERLARNLSLAHQLGAEIAVTAGVNVAEALIALAREKNVTQIVVGKPPRFSILDLWRASLLQRLIRLSGDVDICVARAETAQTPRRYAGLWRNRRFPLAEAAIGAAAVAAVTAAGFAAQRWTGYWSIALLYLSLVILLAMRFSRAGSFVAAALSALAWDFFFIPPPYTFRIQRLDDALMFAMFFVVAIVMSQLTAQLRWREEAERRRERRALALYRLAQSAVESLSLDEALRLALREFHEVFQASAAVFLAGDGGRLQPASAFDADWALSEKDQGVAAWVLLNRRAAGRFTDAVPESEAMFLPLATGKGVHGVLAARFAGPRALALDERDLLEAFCDHIAAMIERYGLIRQSGRVQLAEESEKLYKTLFNSVSHELKTPLSVIAAAAGSLDATLDKAGLPRASVADIENATRRLRRIVDNLLDMSRVESGRLKPELVWCDVDELIETARAQSADTLAGRRLKTDVPDAMPAVETDAGFVAHALANLLANAAHYSPPDGEIMVRARLDDGRLVLQVEDQGPGLSPEVLSHVFEKFYRGPEAGPDGANRAASEGRTAGVGLGLAITQGLMQALGGEARAANLSEGGAVFSLIVPVKTAEIK